VIKIKDYYFTVTGDITMKVKAENAEEAEEKASEWLSDSGDNPISNYEIYPEQEGNTYDWVDYSI
jgi:hypothetical protein